MAKTAPVHTNEKHWYAVYTRSRCEKKMLDELINAGIEAYVPLRFEIHKWSDRNKRVDVPVINSYCFVHIDYDNDRYKIYKAYGFVAFVMHARKPVIIPNSEMDAMKQAVDSKLAIEVENHLLREGKRVRVISGPIKGAIGIVESLSDKNVRILLSTVGITLTVKLSEEMMFEEIDTEE